jgi:DtxR family Mn-dependent transcriptional regulator
VRLSDTGRNTAAALVRRHRIWECFLANELKVPIDEAHHLAHDLEHAAPIGSQNGYSSILVNLNLAHMGVK